MVGVNNLNFGKPTVDNFPKSVYIVNETNNITMVCGADCVPRPTITWTKMSSGKIVGEGEAFHIVAASETDYFFLLFFYYFFYYYFFNIF